MKNFSFLIFIFSLILFSNCNSDDTPVECTPTVINPYLNCCGTAPLEAVLGTGKMYVSNIFTPNGDGNNDLFFPLSNDDIIEIKIFLIKDNQGQEVFKKLDLLASASIVNGWDGRDDDGNALEGIFDYEITVTDNNNQEGTFTGKVCSYPCEAADVTLFPTDNVNGCGFPSQHSGEGDFDIFLPNGEASCF